MPKMRGFLKTKEKIDQKDWEIAQIRTAARLGDLFGADASTADKKAATDAEEAEVAAADTSGILIGPMPWSGGARPPIVVVSVSEVVSVLTDPVEAAPTAVPSEEPEATTASEGTNVAAPAVDETVSPAKPIGITGAGVPGVPPSDPQARPIGVMARPGDVAGPDQWQLPYNTEPRVREHQLTTAQLFQPSAPHEEQQGRPAEFAATVVPPIGRAPVSTVPGPPPAGERLVTKVAATRPVFDAQKAAPVPMARPEPVVVDEVPSAVAPQEIAPSDVSPAASSIAAVPEPTSAGAVPAPPVPAPAVPAAAAPVGKASSLARPAKPAARTARATSASADRSAGAKRSTVVAPDAEQARRPSRPAKALTRTPARATPEQGGRRATDAAPATPKASPKTRVVRLPTRVTPAPTPTPVMAAHCPYCAKVLDPAPTTNKRCERCRQRIVVKRIDGAAVYLTEAAVKVFEAERRRVHNSVRWTRERDRWLGHARVAGAPPERIAQLTSARLSEDVVGAARKLYLTTVDRAFRAARNGRDWDTAGRIRREEATLLHRASGSPAVPQAEVVALYREGVAAVLKGVAEIARDAELVSARCCDTCRADDGVIARIGTELRTPRLPHADCPKGLCRCDWDLPARHRQTLRRYLRRKPTPEVRAVASETRALPMATRAES